MNTSERRISGLLGHLSTRDTGSNISAIDLFDVSNRVCIVTGASSGLGERFARVLYGAGAHVVACARRIKKLEHLASECDEGANPLMIVQCDVTKDEDRKRLVQEVMQKHGRIDVLVNNAGISGDDGIPATKISAETFLHTMDVNVNAIFFLTQQVRLMKNFADYPLNSRVC
jgi:NAD(P)-dependent dehydrogenase (short-subunit alcohol dehydrogenase family)